MTAAGDHRDVEVVIPSIRSLQVLERWRGQLDGVPITVVQDGDPSVDLEVPDGLDVTVWARPDIESLLGERSWVISSLDSACRCFGFLVARARYVYTLDDDCAPPDRPGADPLRDHIENLRTPAHPDYFQHPLRHRVRAGLPPRAAGGDATAISHGLWLDHPDLDALTQRRRPDLRIDVWDEHGSSPRPTPGIGPA